MDENKLFLKIIEDRFQRFKDYYTPMNSDFLSLEQQSMLAGSLSDILITSVCRYQRDRGTGRDQRLDCVLNAGQ